MLRSTLSLFVLLAVVAAGNAVHRNHGAPAEYRPRTEARSAAPLEAADVAATLDEALRAAAALHEALWHRSTPVPGILQESLTGLQARCRALRRRTDHLLQRRAATTSPDGLSERLDALEAALETAHYLAAPTYADFAYAAYTRLDSLNRDLAWLARQSPALQGTGAAHLTHLVAALEAEYVAVWRGLGVREIPRGAAFRTMRRHLGARIAGLGSRIRKARRHVQRALSPRSDGHPPLQA